MSRSILRFSGLNAPALASWLLAAITVVIGSMVCAPVSAQTVVNTPTYVCPPDQACTVQPQWSNNGFSVSGNSAQTIRLELPSNPEAEQATGNDNFGISLGVALGGGFVNSDGPSHGSGTLVLGAEYSLGNQWFLVGDVGFGVASVDGIRVMHTEFVGLGREISPSFRLNFGPRHAIVYDVGHDAMNAILGEVQADFTVGERFHVIPTAGVGMAWFPGRKAGSSEGDQFVPAPTTGGNTGNNTNDEATESLVNTNGLVVAVGVNLAYSF